MTTIAEASKASELAPVVRDSVRDLILVLADTKRVLGMRYADWLLGAPELEAGIALASMAQDEWGHARLLYSMLKDFDEDVDAIEHGRQPADYRSMQALDTAPASWPELVVMNALVDGALSLQLQALGASSYLPLRQRVQKILDEEQFHAAHGRAWVRRLVAAGDEPRAQVAAAARMYLPLVLAWYGPDSSASRVLVDMGVTDAAGSAMRTRFTDHFEPMLAAIPDSAGNTGTDWAWDGFQESSRRTSSSTPDAETIAKIRGDKNRAFLMD
jgi:ring-1,2-phenylacetyl-CoA epoxidase subunit PaaC